MKFDQLIEYNLRNILVMIIVMILYVTLHNN